MSSFEANENIQAYQFQPTRENDDSEGSYETVDDEESDIEENLEKGGRCMMKVESWCKCKHCQSMSLAIECICCMELEESKKLMDSDIGT